MVSGRFLGAVALVVILAGCDGDGPVRSGTQRGTIEICRRTDLVHAAQAEVYQERISLPDRAAFDDFGKVGDDTAAYDKSRRWDLRIVTLQPFELLPGAKCVTVRAEIAPRSRVQVIKPDDYRQLEFAGFAKANGDEDGLAKVPDDTPRVFDTTIRVKSEFK